MEEQYEYINECLKDMHNLLELDTRKEYEFYYLNSLNKSLSFEYGVEYNLTHFFYTIRNIVRYLTETMNLSNLTVHTEFIEEILELSIILTNKITLVLGNSISKEFSIKVNLAMTIEESFFRQNWGEKTRGYINRQLDNLNRKNVFRGCSPKRSLAEC